MWRIFPAAGMGRGAKKKRMKVEEMRFLDKMERKFGRYAIQNLSLMLVTCYGFGYAILFVNADFLQYLTLNPYLILRGQVWRLVSWIIVPPGSLSIFLVLTLYFYYRLGTTLERTWGVFRYNVYLLSGILFTVLGSFVLLGYCYIAYSSEIALLGADVFFTKTVGYFFGSFSTYYVNLSIFLAFALTYPDMQVLLLFMIPVRIKWLGLLDAIMTLILFYYSGIAGRIIIGASLMNLVIFFLATRNMMQMSPRQIRRRQVFRHEVKKGTGTTRHKCAICGRTELDGNLEFRFCSKCEGNYEYCSDHLYTHEHRKRH